MKAVVISFRRGRKNYTPRHFILQVDAVQSKAEAEKLKGRNVVWKSSAGRETKGKIAAAHGNKGLVRAIFERGLPGQAINTEAEVE
ncbi:MAG: 50S ribosomal protein L35ae [archaeon]